MILAHGLGGRADLPVPAWIAVGGAGIAVLFSFIVAYSYWYDAVLFGKSGVRFPAAVQRFLKGPIWVWLWKVLGLLAFALFISAAWFGSTSVVENPAPTWLFIWLWVGIVPISLVFGSAFKAVNPMRTLAELLGRFVPTKRLPSRWGYWPAIFSLVIFLWLELVANRWSVEPRNVALYATIYFVVHTALGVVYGPDWFERGEGFEATSNVIGRLALLGRRDDGEIVLRNPLDGLSSMPTHRTLPAFVALLLGSTVFDGLTRQSGWQAMTRGIGDAQYLISGTLGLLAAWGAVLALYWLAMTLTRMIMPTTTDLSQEFAHTLVPISIGYTVAHYFSYAMFDGQNGLILGADPFATGQNLLGIQNWAFFLRPDGSVGQNLFFLSTDFISWMQVGAIVIGHFIGVMCAHDRSLRLLKPKETVAQLPMLCAMIFFTCMGIYLLLGK